MNRRPWLIPTVVAAAAVILFVAGAAAWEMTAPIRTPPCPANSLCYGPLPPDGHRLHPLRAELLWGASALCALVAVALPLRRYAQAASRVFSGARSQ